MSTVNVDFESALHFNTGDGSLWEPSSWPVRNPNNVFAPETGLPMRPGGHGNTCARLSLLNPTFPRVNDADSYRLELLHRWNASNTSEMYLEAWIYIPSSYPMLEGSNAIFRPLYERYFPLNQMYNGFQLSLWLDRYRPGRPTYMKQVFLITSEQDTGDSMSKAGVREPVYEDLVLSDSDAAVMPVFDQWFMVRSYVKRDTAKWDGGVMRMWIALPPDYEVKLVYERLNARTIGVDPALMDSVVDYLADGYFCSGFSNYPGSAALADAVTLYFDDIVLSGAPLDGEVPPPPPPPPRDPWVPLAIAAFGLGAVALGWYATKKD